MQQVDYDASAASNDGTPISFSVPTGIQAGNNYFFVLFAYADARRKMLNNVSPAGTAAAETQTYVTGAFTVYDYAPTPAPSPSPSTAAPSNVKAGPTMNPTYEPTPKPVEEIPCTATVESGIPDDKVWEWGQDVELKIKMCHWYSYSYGVVDVLLYGDEPNADPVDSLAQYQSVHDNTLTVKYTVPQCTDPDLVTGECKTTGLNFPDNGGVSGVETNVGSSDSFKLRIIEYGHGLDTGGWSSAGTWDRQDLEFKIRTKHIQAPTPEPTKAPSQDGTIDCFHTALFTKDGLKQVEMNKIRKFSTYGDGLTAPLAPGAEIVANIEYWPLDRYSSGSGTNRGGTYKKATAKEGQLAWSEDNDQGRFVYPYVDGPTANTDGGVVAGGILKNEKQNTVKATESYAGVCSKGDNTDGDGPGATPPTIAGCESDERCADTDAVCILAAYGAVCSDDMMAPCAMDTDCPAPATCVLKPTDRQGYLTEPEPMHTYWPFGYNRTTHQTVYGWCPLTAGSNDNCCCEVEGKVGYFKECEYMYPTGTKTFNGLFNVIDTCDKNDMTIMPIYRQNVTVAAKATKVTLRLCRGECHNDKNLGHVDDAGDRKKGDKESADAHGVVGGKVPLTLPDDLETADDYRILVHEESTGLTCRSDYFTIANAGEVPTPSPVRKAPPTPRPTEGATHAPTPAPTPSTITFVPEPQFWQKESTQTVEIRIGDVDQAYSYGFGAVVDLLLYEADGADPVGTLAVYAQVAGNKLSVDYPVPAGLAGTDFRLRAIEYTRGLDVYSKPFAIGDGAPTAKPTAKASTADTVVVEVSGVDVGGTLEKDKKYDLQVRFM